MSEQTNPESMDRQAVSIVSTGIGGARRGVEGVLRSTNLANEQPQKLE
jgi:hypothetical protein